MVAVFLWTLKGCPVRIILFAITLLGSGLTNEPVATNSGAVRLSLALAPCFSVEKSKSTDPTYREDHPFLSTAYKAASRK